MNKLFFLVNDIHCKVSKSIYVCTLLIVEVPPYGLLSHDHVPYNSVLVVGEWSVWVFGLASICWDHKCPLCCVDLHCCV